MNTNEHNFVNFAKKECKFMLTLERQEEILSILNENKSATVDELASELFVSSATIRRDLREMEKQGLKPLRHVKKQYVAGRFTLKYNGEDDPWGFNKNTFTLPPEEREEIKIR